MNPLREFISKGRLFEGSLNGSKGIAVEKGNALTWLFSSILGSSEPITIAGDTIYIDKKSADDFFRTHAPALKTILHDEMNLQEKILRLLKYMKKSLVNLPRGLFENTAIGGVEGRRKVVGTQKQFTQLLSALEHQGFTFKEDGLKRELTSVSSGKYVQFDREAFFDRLIRENTSPLETISTENAREEIKEVIRLLLERSQ